MHEVYWLTRGDVAFFEKGVQLGPGRRRPRIRWRSVSKEEKETRAEKGGSRENKENRGGGRGSGRQRGGLVGGAGRQLSKDDSVGEERPIEGIQERGKVEGMKEGASHVLLKERAGENKEKMEEAREGDSGGTGPGGIRAALRKDRGSDKADGGGITTVGDLERRNADIAGIYGVREVYYGMPLWCPGFW